MKKPSLAWLIAVVAGLFGAAEQAHAFTLPCDIGFVETTIVCYRSEIRCRDVQCTVMKKVCREVVEMKKIVVPIPYTEMVKRTVYVCRNVPEEVVRDIHVAVECPTCTTGCGCGCKPNPASYKTTIKCVESKPKPVPVEITEPVCKVRTQEKLVPSKKVVVDEVPETITRKEYYCVKVPYEIKVKLPMHGCGH